MLTHTSTSHAKRLATKRDVCAVAAVVEHHPNLGSGCLRSKPGPRKPCNCAESNFFATSFFIHPRFVVLLIVRYDLRSFVVLFTLRYLVSCCFRHVLGRFSYFLIALPLTSPPTSEAAGSAEGEGRQSPNNNLFYRHFCNAVNDTIANWAGRGSIHLAAAQACQYLYPLRRNLRPPLFVYLIGVSRASLH